MQVVFESRPDKPTKPADVARPGSPGPTVSASPPPAASSFRSVPEDNPGRNVVDDNSPPPAALMRPAAPSLAIPPLPPRYEEVRFREYEQVHQSVLVGLQIDLRPCMTLFLLQSCEDLFSQ